MKYGLLGDAPFFAWLEGNWQKIFYGKGAARASAIATSCRAKSAIVEADEREESGTRALLNLGHTFGHALEAFAGYSDRLLHGEAIAIGMRLAFSFSAEQGFIPASDVNRVGSISCMLGYLAASPTFLAACPRRKSCFSSWRRTRR